MIATPLSFVRRPLETKSNQFRFLVMLVCGLGLTSSDVSVAQSSALKSKSRVAKPKRTPDQLSTNEKVLEFLNERVTADDIRDDLDALKKVFDEKWILVDANGIDFSILIDALKKKAEAGLARHELVFEIQKILAQSIDGHAGVAELPFTISLLNDGHHTPFAIGLSNDRYVAYAVENDQSEVIHPRCPYKLRPLRKGFPYLEAMDGLPMESWIKSMEDFFPKGPAYAMRQRCVHFPFPLKLARERLGLEQRNQLIVKLAAEDPIQSIEVELETSKFGVVSVPVPRPERKLMEGNFGYFWLDTCAQPAVENILAAMPEFRETDGLIVDLRGNRGGTAEASFIMAAFLVPKDKPTAINGVSEVPRGMTQGFYVPKTRGLSEDDRQLMTDFDAEFHPNWIMPKHQKLSRTFLLFTNPNSSGAKYFPWDLPANKIEPMLKAFFHYEKPVVILSDYECFSAAEVFLSTIREFPQVTLVGCPTRSGAGNPVPFPLERTEIRVVLSKNVFVRKSGELIDGKGIEPDFEIHPEPGYYFGTSDRMLDKAVEILKSRQARGTTKGQKSS
jgi:hypothetical protein